MRIPTFILERSQTLYENDVAINLTESGVHPAAISDILSEAELAELAALPLGYGYTDGTPSLRDAVAAWYPGAGSENVLIAHGSSEANLLTLMALAERGDHIIVVVPNFMQIDGLAHSLGIDVTQVALRPGDDWQPDIAALEAAIGPRTKLITLCDPNNPTGTTLTQSSRRALAELSDRTGVWLHVDEIYRGSEIDAVDAPTIYGMGKRVIVTGGLAKSFGCPGLRMGWMIGPQALVAECHRFQDYTSIGTGVVSQFIAERALREPVRGKLLSRGRHILAAGRQRVAKWLDGRDGWSWVVPQASGMAFLRYDMDVPSEAFVDGLRRAKGVFVCAGSWFGIEGHIRVGFGVDPHHLESGLAGIDDYLREERSFN
ncbi:aminotransferase class I/II-fold pyridoxal phosphate-dependent enzyme [Mesorhizobium sp.]|uniref:aminotransferase class I/II-fold pyridoxal phosphate-dependent enzyme n=1 Tax=Mesorhizobium sp. TaxID=1871066 RepID=UPI0025F76105|nr:aminotransferase class I/II-fold pyridoxal phosphate-dependent enzyme [Mesorhizobium sp.]